MGFMQSLIFVYLYMDILTPVTSSNVLPHLLSEAFMSNQTPAFSSSPDPCTCIVSESESSGLPSRQAHPSTNRNVSRLHTRFMSDNRTGTKAMMISGNAGAATVRVTPKTMPVMMICAIVYM